ncbi:MAG: hypothetical protein KJN99_11080 [Marinicaulis sp.]|nr:hypothetical protein [Marinicaulis sp.]
MPEAIIVGISYGSFYPKNGNYRATDYSTPPLPEEFRNGVDDGDVHGGAAAFQQFIKYEVIKHIEENYRTDPSRRILMGQSRGAHFALYSAHTDPDLFWGRIASNPSFEPNKDIFFADETLPDMNNAKLYVSSAERDLPDLKSDANAWAARWESDTPPWELKFAEPAGETHAAGIVRVYRDGMKWLFGGE